MPAELATLLRQAVASGDYSDVGRALAPGAVLVSSSEAGRRRIAGAEAIAAHLSGPGPGEVAAWDAREWPGGVAVTFEWIGATGADRRRWYVRRDPGGPIREWWSYAARPRGGAPGTEGAPGAGGAERAKGAGGASDAAGTLGAVGAERAEGAVGMPGAGGAAGGLGGVLERLGPGARRAPLEHAGNSGAALERIALADGRELVAKRVAPGSDWLGRATGDLGRTALLWEAGAFARMPRAIDHGIVAVERDGDGAWVLMRDLSRALLGDERRLSREESRAVLGAAAALHRAFAGDPPPGAATLRDRLGMSSPAVAEAERHGSDLLPKQFEAAWEAFAEVVDPDVAEPVLAAAADPAPLARALERAAGRLTLIHGDLRDDNLGFDGDRVVLLDWDLATAGTPTVEFAWYLCHDAWRIDATHDEIEADYAAAEPEAGELERELGVASGLVQYGWIFGHSARIHPDPAEQDWAAQELGWWVPRVRRALERTGGLD